MEETRFVTLAEFQQARNKLCGLIEETPLLGSATFSKMSGNQVYMKAENLQKTGSFKIRGAYNNISSLSPQQRERGVITCSAGNAGAGVAYAASLLGVKSTVVVPANFVKAKSAAMRGYGAEVIPYGTTSGEMFRYTMELAEKHGYAMIQPYEAHTTIAGQGTIGLEIFEQLPQLEAVVVQASGGGLLAGIAACIKQLKPTVRVIGVNPEKSDAMYQSLKADKLVTVPVTTIADGLGVETPGALNFAYVKKFVDEFVTVSEEEICEATRLLGERGKLVVEPAGATSLAAVIFKKVSLVNKKTVVILSGGNTDPDILTDIYMGKYRGKAE